MDEAKKIVRPTKCPKCRSTNITAFVPNAEYVAHKLIDGQWEYREGESYDSDYLDWDSAYYRCDDCDNEWVAEQGQALKTVTPVPPTKSKRLEK